MGNHNLRPWHVVDAGSGTPIVFLHNGGGTSLNWAYQLDHFSSSYRVIAPDLPGFGLSPRPAAPLTLDFYVQGLADLLEALNVSNPILAGNCIGSSIALEFALRQPDKVKALVLFNVCGGLPMLNSRLRFWAGLRPATSLGRRFHQFMIDAAGHPALHRLNASLLYAGSEPLLHPDLQQFAEQQRLEPALRASLYWLAMGLDSFGIFTQVREKPCQFPPVLLGWGQQNQVLNVRWADVIAGWLKPDRFWLLENTGHMPMYEQPEQVNAMLGEFFQEVVLV
ncbi:MAG: alpha/beta hydrolase [Anaerolineales bacterium]|nr:alpha/beta hydrolase [Anaerolineales bacterium]